MSVLSMFHYMDRLLLCPIDPFLAATDRLHTLRHCDSTTLFSLASSQAKKMHPVDSGSIKRNTLISITSVSATSVVILICGLPTRGRDLPSVTLLICIAVPQQHSERRDRRIWRVH